MEKTKHGVSSSAEHLTNENLRNQNLIEGTTAQKNYECEECRTKLKKRNSYNKHLADHASQFLCHLCNNVYKRKHDLKRHLRRKHADEQAKNLSSARDVWT